MRELIPILGLAVLWPFGVPLAQVPNTATPDIVGRILPGHSPNAAGVAMGYLHLNVTDVEANKKFWTELGGTVAKLDETAVMKFPGILIFLTSEIGRAHV